MTTTIRSSENNHAEGWAFGNGEIEMFLTKTGGQHAPVTFFADSAAPVQPYFLNLWGAEAEKLNDIPLLKYLRGDFFCLPFGGNGDTVNGVQYQCHGETSANEWSQDSATEADGVSVFTFSLDTKLMPAHVVKRIEMHKGQSALYISHTVTGLDATMPYGHHTILRMPEKNEKMYFSCGKFDLGMTPTSLFSNPEGWEYQYLASGATFDKVEAIPTCFKSPDTCDFSVYPTPAGFADLFALLKKPTDTPAWATAAYPDAGYLYYSLKDADVLPSTTIWVSNSGRYEFPWNGLARCFAIEETCSYFADGWKPSIEDNELTRRGWKTCAQFKANTPFTVKHIQGVVAIPKNFTKVAKADFAPGQITFTDELGNAVTANVDWENNL